MFLPMRRERAWDPKGRREGGVNVERKEGGLLYSQVIWIPKHKQNGTTDGIAPAPAPEKHRQSVLGSRLG